MYICVSYTYIHNDVNYNPHLRWCVRIISYRYMNLKTETIPLDHIENTSFPIYLNMFEQRDVTKRKMWTPNISAVEF